MTSFAAVVFRPAEISDRALSQGFAVAVAGWDVESPRLLIAPLPSLPGYAAAFYACGAKAGDDEIEHAFDLFEDDVPPALAVLDAALDEGQGEARVYAITYAEGALHDDAWRFDARGYERRFVHEDDDGVEAGRETHDGEDAERVVAPADASPRIGADADAQRRALEAAARPHRGSTFLSSELGAPALAALIGALYAVERRLDVRLVAAGADAIAAETARLVGALGRVGGRGAFAPGEIAGVAPPRNYDAFVRAYDWADPSDPRDLYRELSIGAIEGTLRFLREADASRLDDDDAWRHAARGCYPVAELVGSALGGSAAQAAVVAVDAQGEHLVVVRAGRASPAGPTLGELLRYLGLGWSTRSEPEEDMIGALMLRARLRADRA